MVIFIDLLKPICSVEASFSQGMFYYKTKGTSIYKQQKANPLETETVSKMNYTQNEHKECVPATLQDVGIIINIYIVSLFTTT